jgi:hypothetical protein
MVINDYFNSFQFKIPYISKWNLLKLSLILDKKYISLNGYTIIIIIINQKFQKIKYILG